MQKEQEKVLPFHWSILFTSNNFTGSTNRRLVERKTRKKMAETSPCCLYFVFSPYLRRTKNICGVLRNLVPLIQFKKREQHPWRSFTISKVAGLACNFTKSNTPLWVFLTFFKLCTWH